MTRSMGGNQIHDAVKNIGLVGANGHKVSKSFSLPPSAGGLGPQQTKYAGYNQIDRHNDTQ
jgi:hypothetical protein